jgi:hypothetical protein
MMHAMMNGNALERVWKVSQCFLCPKEDKENSAVTALRHREVSTSWDKQFVQDTAFNSWFPSG